MYIYVCVCVCVCVYIYVCVYYERTIEFVIVSFFLSCFTLLLLCSSFLFQGKANRRCERLCMHTCMYSYYMYATAIYVCV